MHKSLRRTLKNSSLFFSLTSLFFVLHIHLQNITFGLFLDSSALKTDIKPSILWTKQMQILYDKTFIFVPTSNIAFQQEKFWPKTLPMLCGWSNSASDFPLAASLLPNTAFRARFPASNCTRAESGRNKKKIIKIFSYFDMNCKTWID